MHRLPWGSPAPIYVRFAIPRTEKRQCLCSGQPVPLPPNTPIRCITIQRRQRRAAKSERGQFGISCMGFPISEIIPTRNGYTFMGWANSRTGKPIYGGNGGYTSCLVVHGYDMSTTIYAIWEVHNHSWGEWTSNGNGTHTRTCITTAAIPKQATAPAARPPARRRPFAKPVIRPTENFCSSPKRSSPPRPRCPLKVRRRVVP